jgi:hypothetical protein
MTGVIIGIAAPNKAVVGNLVPFFARDLAGFAPDADGRIGEEADRGTILDVGVSPLVRALNAFANHVAGVMEWWSNGEMQRTSNVTTPRLQHSIIPSPFIPIFRAVRDRQYVCRLRVRRVEVVRDVNSAARFVARIFQTTGRNRHHVANVPERCYRGALSLP